MRGRRLPATASALLGGLLLGVTAFAAAPPPFGDHVPGEVLVRFTNEIAARRHAADLALLGASEAVRRGNLQRLRLPRGSSVANTVAYLDGLDGIVVAQPNYRYRFTALPNDPDVGQQWAVQNTGQTIFDTPPGTPIYSTSNPGSAGSDLGLDAAWEVRSDCSGVIVAVIDSGVDYTHADLAGSMWDGTPVYPNPGWDTTGSGDDDPAPDTGIAEDDHGSHVAGIVGAAGNNGIGTTGVCQRAELMALRAGSFASGLTTLDVIEAIAFAIDNGAAILNMSFGGEMPLDALFSAAIDDARSAGVLVVAAAGNDALDVDGPGTDGLDTTRFYPCAFPQDNVVCVAASDQADERAVFSNFGPASVDAAAPGTNILSTSYADDFAVISGTSMATPQASGVAALIWAQNPAYGYREVRAALLEGARPASAWSGLTVTGGVIHADGGVRHLRPPTGLAFTLD